MNSLRCGRRGGGGFSLFPTEDLASRDLCVPVYMRETEKNKDNDNTYIKEKKKKTEKINLYKLQQCHTEPFSFSTSLVTTEPSVQRLCGLVTGGGAEPAAWR